MPERVHNQRQYEHTIILRPRDSRVARVQENGLNLAHYAPARIGSVPYVRPVPRHGYGPPPRAEPLPRLEQDSGYERGGDLLVRFGIDSVFGRVVARVLMCFLLLQPVYVAFGAELGEAENYESGITNYEDVGATSDGVDEGLETIEDTSDSEDGGQQITDGETLQPTTYNLPPTSDGGEYPLPTSPYEGEEASDDHDAPHSNPLPEGEVVNDGDSGNENGDSESSNLTADGSGDTGDSSEVSDDGTMSDDELTGDSLEVTGEAGDGVPHPNPLLEGEGADASNGGDEGQQTTEDGPLPPTTYNLPPTSDGATTTDDGVVEEDVPDTTIASETNEGNKYTFGEGDCTLVADGEFYCVAPTVARHATGDPRVYAEKDREGDREVYYFDGVEIHRITNNGYDDFAPVFDDTTLRIAWQANIQDRMQIMVHDLSTGSTRQVTSARENSSNPNLLGSTLVWQQWIDTNWEVMRTDVDTTEEFDIERLTDNAVHDMFPRLYDGLTTWQREKGASWEVIVHDDHTGVERALEKFDDTKYENPRFVLLFDSTHENGDVETIGYDLDTGEMMELGTRANPQPIAPITPKDEVPDAPVTTASSTLVKVKEGVEGEAGLGEGAVGG